MLNNLHNYTINMIRTQMNMFKTVQNMASDVKFESKTIFKRKDFCNLHFFHNNENRN
jgi:hypothetical protein